MLLSMCIPALFFHFLHCGILLLEGDCMRYRCTLLAVRDMERSKRFYHDVLGLDVVEDLGANVTLTGGIALQTDTSWAEFLHLPAFRLIFGGNDAELYLETSDIEGFCRKLSDMDQILYVHPLQEHAWGQRVIRIYDPDRHIIEVGEQIGAVAQRFLDQGMTLSEVAARMDSPEEAVRSWLGENQTT